jgi:D-amino-acid dehydrogenase
VLHYPDAARVDGRGMAEALRQAAERRGVRFISGAVAGVEGENGPGGGGAGGRGVHRLRIDADVDDVRCGALVIAGGAWSAQLGAQLGCPLPITPTKGQIVHLDTAHATDDWPIVQPLLTHYLVPWPGGRVACGGTFEPGAGFSATVTAAGLQELLRECLAVAPGMADAQYLFARAGLRPTSPDDRPVVGTLPGWHNVWVATGHGANGLLLGPFTALLLAARITTEASGGGSMSVPDELDPARFL